MLRVPATQWKQSLAGTASRRGFWNRSYTQDTQKEEQKSQDEKKEGQTEQPKAETEQPQGQQTEQQLTPEQQKIKELEAVVEKYKDDYLRSVADQQNLVRRTKNDVESAKLFGIKGFATSILEVADNLERALGTVTETKRTEVPELESLYNGIEMTEKILIRILEKHGVTKFSPVDEKFNPSLHEALFEVHDPSKTPGTVAIVQAAGYSLNGRLLRPAQVGVVAAPPASSS